MGMVFAVLFKVKTSISIKDGELDKEVLFPIGSIYTHPQGISLPPPREPSFGQAATGAPPGGQGASGLLPSPCAASLYSLWLPPLGPGSPGSRGLRKPRREEKERKDGEKLHKATELGCLSALSPTSIVQRWGGREAIGGKEGVATCSVHCTLHPSIPPSPRPIKSQPLSVSYHPFTSPGPHILHWLTSPPLLPSSSGPPAPAPSEWMLQVTRTTSDNSRRLGRSPGNVRGRSPHFCSHRNGHNRSWKILSAFYHITLCKYSSECIYMDYCSTQNHTKTYFYSPHFTEEESEA